MADEHITASHDLDFIALKSPVASWRIFEREGKFCFEGDVDIAAAQLSEMIVGNLEKWKAHGNG